MSSDGESDYDEEFESEPPRFYNVEVSSAMQNCRCFNDVPLDSDKCIKVIMDMLYLLYTGRASLSEDEATDLFLMSTKLMQSSNSKLRRLHYVLIKELAPKVEASYIASNSLMMDMKNPSDIIRRNALRTLFAVMDGDMYHSMDRTIVESINSKNPEVVNTALVTGIHLAAVNLDMAKKWANQVSQQRYDGGQTTYSKTALLHCIRTNDRLSAQRLMEDAQSGAVRAPLALALIVNVCAEQLKNILSKTGNHEEGAEFLKFINSMTQHHSELVWMQACQRIVSLPNLSDSEVSLCVSALGSRVLSHNPVTRFCAVAQLSELAKTHPLAVNTVSATMEPLVGDSHSGVATYAVIILLLTGSETSVNNLLTKLSQSGALKGMEDDFKLIMINSTLDLYKKFPQALEAITNFLFVALGEVQSPLLKQRVVDTMIYLSKTNPGTKETILTKLADCIDDCDFPAMTKRVLGHLSEEVPHCSNPRQYVRYIYNHCKLEQADIRAVAVRTLAKIAAKLPKLRAFIVPLIARCCTDEDDEVRDRAVFYTKLFRSNDSRLIEVHITEVAAQVASQRHAVAGGMAKTDATGRDAEGAGRTQKFEEIGAGHRSLPDKAAGLISPVALEGRDAMLQVDFFREQFGSPAKSCEPVALTEQDNEYAVSLIKHITSTHVILQFRILNTMEAGSFAQVTVNCDTAELEAEPKYSVPADLIPPGEVRYAYVVLEYEESVFPSGEVPCSISFSIVEEGETPDPANQEEFSMESFEMDISDFFRPLAVNFEEKWEAAEESGETAGTYELQSMKNLTVAVREIAAFYGLYVVDGVPEKVTAASHTLLMSGTAVNQELSLVLIKAKVFISTADAVVLQMAIRGADDALRDFITNALLS